MKLLILLILVYSSVKAATLECKSFINLDQVGSAEVATSLKNKVLIDKTEQIISYVTEVRPDVFSVEAFIPKLEIRIYSESALKSLNETLTASVWERDIMADVVCKKIK